MNLIQGSDHYNSLKKEALSLFGVSPSKSFDVTKAISSRVSFLKENLLRTNMKGYVLGISGGVDSTAAGRLCQIACSQLRDEGYMAHFIAVRLPAGVQIDEDDAQSAITFINADKTLTVNIGEAATNLNLHAIKEYEKIEGAALDLKSVDFNKGNIKARLRMTSQYQVAAMYGALVVGSTHNAEGITGFYTKWADNSCDLTILDGLNKNQVRLITKELGAPKFLWDKAPTADLEELDPGKLDEDGFGYSYHELDMFLEGESVDKDTEYKIISQYQKSQHKRRPIPSFS